MLCLSLNRRSYLFPKVEGGLTGEPFRTASTVLQIFRVYACSTFPIVPRDITALRLYLLAVKDLLKRRVLAYAELTSFTGEVGSFKGIKAFELIT